MKTEPPSMKHVSWCPSLAAVNGVPKQSVPDMRHVNSNLVRAPRVQSALNNSHIRPACVNFVQQLPLGARMPPAPLTHDGHFLAVNWVPSDRGVHFTRFLTKTPESEGEVNL
jgi:hypothetical protein